MRVALLFSDRNRGDGDDNPGEPEIAPVTPVEFLDDRMVLREVGEGGIRKHERPIENLIRVNDRRQESLNIAAVKNRLLLGASDAAASGSEKCSRCAATPAVRG